MRSSTCGETCSGSDSVCAFDDDARFLPVVQVVVGNRHRQGTRMRSVERRVANFNRIAFLTPARAL
ncbi:MAG TPA: hypothetical protein VGB99_14365, partial [Acidobacteriota bacterium]